MMNASNAYIKLAQIAEQHHAQKSESFSVTERPLWMGIRFLLQGRRLICPVSEVVEVLTLPKITQVPGVLPWMKGVANVRGRLLPVVDLNLYLLNESDERYAHERRLLVIEKGTLYCGLIVDQVLGRQHQPANEFSVADCVEPGLKPYITGQFSGEDGEIWQILSLVRLLENPNFFNAAL